VKSQEGLSCVAVVRILYMTCYVAFGNENLTQKIVRLCDCIAAGSLVDASACC